MLGLVIYDTDGSFLRRVKADPSTGKLAEPVRVEAGQTVFVLGPGGGVRSMLPVIKGPDGGLLFDLGWGSAGRVAAEEHRGTTTSLHSGH